MDIWTWRESHREDEHLESVIEPGETPGEWIYGLGESPIERMSTWRVLYAPGESDQKRERERERSDLERIVTSR